MAHQMNKSHPTVHRHLVTGSVWLLGWLFVVGPYAHAQTPASQSPHGALALACSDCHGGEAWVPLSAEPTFDHERDANYPLIGAHATATCTSCHNSLDFSTVEAASCNNCHADVHQGQFGTTCTSCHNSVSFEDVEGDRIHQMSAFPLEGAHAAIACESCHTDDADGAFSPLPTTCQSCHLGDFEQAHPEAGFPDGCLDCHNTLSFQGAVFDHAQASDGFALLGVHQVLACASCHTEENLEPIWLPASQNDCYTCHVSDFEQAHPEEGYPTTCLDCHNTLSFSGSTFDHAEASGGFALVGAHEVLACASCHVQGSLDPIWNPTSQNDCLTCHVAEFEQAHPEAGYPTTCLDCHTTLTFEGATFDHVTASGGFGLVGAHETLPCASCHVSGTTEPIWNPISQDDCLSCHLADFEKEHPEPGFPTTCLDCHTTLSFDDSTFDHDALYFPIYSGEHRGEWSSCATCHNNPANFKSFTCLDCHEHRQSEMDDEHDDVQGYVYDSPYCYSCHPDGREPDDD